jgi:regulator of sigma E protease
VDFLLSLLGNAWALFLIALFFGSSIFVHELGHFLIARWRGARVERFSIGFGPAIWSWQGRDGVEYRLSWIPLGGYVLLPQLADMSGVEGEASLEAKALPPLDYTSKMLILVAGVVCNVLFAFVLACGLWGLGLPVSEEEQTTRIGYVHPTLELQGGKEAPGPAYVAGVQPGDVIREVDGKTVHSFMDIDYDVAIGAGRGDNDQPRVDLLVERDGRMLTITVFPAKAGAEEMRSIGVEPGVKVTISEVAPSSSAEAAGLKPGDIITQLEGQPVNYTGFVADYVRQNNGRAILLTYQRGGEAHTATLVPRLTPDPATKKIVPRLGVVLRGAITEKMVRIAPWIQVVDPLVKTWRGLMSAVNRHSDIGPSKFSGPGGIARGFWLSAKSDYPIRAVLSFAIMLNISLAVFNLLPSPILDGGHMLFATIGRVRGRLLPPKFIAAAQSVSIVLLLSLVLYVTFFDVRRFWPMRPTPQETAPEPVGTGK